jgi:hypothetical protein
VDPAKIRIIQRTTGSQYLKNDPFPDTPGWKQSRRVGVEFKVRPGTRSRRYLRFIRFAKPPVFWQSVPATMRFITLIAIATALACGLGCRKKESNAKTGQPAEASVFVRWHFVGSSFLAGNTNAAKLKELWALPATRRLAEQTLQKLAHSPRVLFGDRITQEEDERGAPLLRPMLDDLIHHESFLQVSGPTDKTAEWTLLVQLPAERIKVWQDNLIQLMQVWKLGTPVTNSLEGFPGWEVKRASTPALIRCVEAGQWLALGIGQDQLASVSEAARRIKTGGRPVAAASDYWLQTEMNLPRLREVLDLSPTIKWPRATLNVVAQGENLRSNVRMVFPEPVTGPLDPWLVPTNIINDPLISFTAARGIAPWLKNCESLQRLELTPTPNELFCWAQAHVAFQSFLAFPLDGAVTKLERAGGLAASLLDTNWQSRGLAQIAWQTNREVLWKGLPYITPYLHAAEFHGTDFVMGGLFPPAPLTNPPPAELLSQLTSQPKLVYYDWEITQARLASWRILAQLFSIIADKPQFTTNTAGLPWMMAVESKLGNTITEITADSSTEWSLVRKSHIGFTGIELVALTRWLESTNFPKLSFELAQDRHLKRSPPPPGGTVAAPPRPAASPPGK